MSAADTRGQQMAFRIALRREGDKINSYLATMGTMENALFLGCLSYQVACVPGAFEGFQVLMQNTVSHLTKQLLGEDVASFVSQDAPEHEKAGHA